jgi:hypothetical protein
MLLRFMVRARKSGESRGFCRRNQNIEHDRHENGVRGVGAAF